MFVGYLLLISWDVNDPGEAWRNLRTLCWTLSLLTFNNILGNKTAIRSLSCKFTIVWILGEVPACLVCGGIDSGKSSSSGRSSTCNSGSQCGRLADTHEHTYKPPLWCGPICVAEPPVCCRAAAEEKGWQNQARWHVGADPKCVGQNCWLWSLPSYQTIWDR